MKRILFVICTIGVIIGLFFIAKLGYNEYRESHPINIYKYRSDINHKQNNNYIVEFYDLKCPTCKKAHKEVFENKEFNNLLDDKKVTVKYIPHPVLNNNGVSNKFANMADSVNDVMGIGAYHSFINESYNNMDEKDPIKVMKKLDYGNDLNKKIIKNYKAKDINQYPNTKKQEDQFNIEKTPTIFLNDEKVSYKDLQSRVENLK